MNLKENNFWKRNGEPIKVLAPMAGYTDSAFRLLCRDMGADIVVTELISADAIAYGKFKVESRKSKVFNNELRLYEVISGKNQPTANLLSFFEEERPLVVQLFGKNPDTFAKAAHWLTKELRPDGIDINMGCPARKVVNSSHGVALMKNPDLAAEIVRAVTEHTNLPVSVKTRLGWEKENEILEFAPVIWRAGISAITIHGRTYKDGFKGKAKWENIYKIKDMVGDSLAVIGNGDYPNYEIQLKNLDGYAIGRAVFGQPWIFSRSVVSKDELKEIILRHAKIAFEVKGNFGILEFRKHLLAYLKGFPGAKELRKQAVSVVDFRDVSRLVSTL